MDKGIPLARGIAEGCVQFRVTVHHVGRLFLHNALGIKHRWLGAISLSHPLLVSMCEVRNSEYELYNEGWSVEEKRNAQAHLYSFEFVYTLVTSLLCLKLQ